jgi:Galactose oxidase, central domain
MTDRYPLSRTSAHIVPSRILGALVPLLMALVLPSGAAAQPTPGQNVNMVSGTQWPGGDPFLQRQNEPSIAVSSRNPLHLLAGANDYRTVDLPLQDTVPGEGLAGDAWLGVFKSFNGGQSWQSTLIPGYPQDQTPEGMASPVKGFTTAADPVVRAGTNGLFYYSGIAFNRGTNQGMVFLSVWLDLDNKENGDATSTPTSMNTDPIRYIRTVPIASGNAGQFLDKPWLAVDIPRAGAQTCSFQVPVPGGGTVPQSFPGGNVYMAYSVFVGNQNNIRTKLYFTRSTDCGATWSQPTKLSEGYPVNQGSIIAIDPSTGYVYVAWRGFATVNTPNTINIAKSTDGGATFTKGTTVVSLPTFDPANPTAPSFFDQGTTAGTFRTNAFPALAVDGSGRVYLAWSQRTPPDGDARIMMATSPDGNTWSTPFPVDNGPVIDDYMDPFTRGHQFMPSMVFSGGKLAVLYYDQRLDHTVGQFFPNEPFDMAHGKFYDQRRILKGELLNSGGASEIFNPVLSDAGLTLRRHTIDVRVAEADPRSAPVFLTAPVSQYKFGTEGGPADTDLLQLQVDPPNLPMFQLGHVPFFGDYIDITSQMFVKDATGNWTFNTAASAGTIQYASWTTNQDVVPPYDPTTNSIDWTKYTPPISALNPGDGSNQSIYDPTQTVPNCNQQFTGSRNQNIYSSRITQGLVLSSPQNSKPLSTTLQREFVVNLRNETGLDRSFRLTIGDGTMATQPPGGYASFTPGMNNPGPPALPPTPPMPVVMQLDVTVGAHAGISRSVFAVSSNPTASMTVNTVEIDAPGGTAVAGGLSSFLVLNADGTVPPLADPDDAPAGTSIQTLEIYNPNVTNPNVTNPNVTNPNVTNTNTANPNVTNPNVTNPNVTNPNVTNPNVTNPNVTNPDITDPNVTNPNVTNPNVTNPNVTNPNVTNPNVTNPNVTNPNVTNYPVADSTYTVTNGGNTTSTYQVKLARVGSTTTDAQLQLLVNKSTPVLNSDNCYLFPQYENTLLANVPNPVSTDLSDLGNSTVNDPSVKNVTFSLAPGETALVTLRGNFRAGTTDEQAQQDIQQIAQDVAVPVVVPSAPNTNDPTNTIQVTPPGGIFITTTSIPDAVVGQPYSTALQTIGGFGAHFWSATGLPAGLSIDNNGTISGAATDPAGNYGVTVTVMDSATPTPNTAVRQFTLRLADPLVISTPSPLPTAPVGSPYNQALAATGGIPPVTWVLIGGSLPTGLSLAPNGVISGTATTQQTSNFTVQATDSANPAQVTSSAFAISAVTLQASASASPASLTAGQTFSLTVHVQDNQGAPIPGANVSISLGAQPCATAVLSGGTVAQTNVVGDAVFNLSIGSGGNGYTILATVNAIPFPAIVATSNPIDVEGFCATGGLNTPRAYATTTLLADGRVLIAGGQDANQTILDTAEIYDPSTGAFTPTAGPMTVARRGHQAVLLPSGQVLIVGGVTTGGVVLASAELFDPSTGLFTATGSMNVPRVNAQATWSSFAGKVVVTGGSNTGGQTATAEVYDPATGQFGPAGNMNQTREFHTATELTDGRILIVGGAGSGPATAELWDPTSGLFTATGPLPQTPDDPSGVRDGQGAIGLPDGRVLLAGGEQSPSTSQLSSALVFDPSTNGFTTIQSMSTPRSFPLLSLLPSGKVVAAGGYGSNSIPNASVEIFAPATNAFSLTGAMATTHGAGGAALLSTGQVLIAGGDQFSSPTAELFDPFPPACTASSLVNAVTLALANANPSNTLTLNSTCDFVFTSGSVVDLSTALPHIPNGKDLTIDGLGAIIERLPFPGSPAFRLFTVDPGATLTLKNMTVRNAGCALSPVCAVAGGPSFIEGGAILNEGTLNVSGSTFSANRAGGDVFNSRGGAIETVGFSPATPALTVDQSTFSGNSADDNGGAIFNWGGSLSVTSSTFAGNHARAAGGALIAFSWLNSTVLNSTFFGNTANGITYSSNGFAGTAIFNQTWQFAPDTAGALSVTQATFFGNGAPGTIAMEGASFDQQTQTTVPGVQTNLANSVIAGSGGANCGGAGTVTDGGYNFSADGTCGLSGTGSQNNATLSFVSPGLANNGGPTQTIVPLSSSPAVNSIPSGVNGCGTTITTDQRGFVRPLPPSTACDAGAVEQY